MTKIRLQRTESVADVFDSFLLSKKAQGIADKTAATYAQHFHAISKHLDVQTDITALNSKELDTMVESMRRQGLAPNSIRSYTARLSERG